MCCACGSCCRWRRSATRVWPGWSSVSAVGRRGPTLRWSVSPPGVAVDWHLVPGSPMTSTRQDPSRLAELLSEAFKEEEPAKKLKAFCNVWKEIHDDLGWIDRFAASAVAANQNMLFKGDLSGLIPSIKDKIASNTGANDEFLRACEINLKMLPRKINWREESARATATRTAASVGGVYSQLTILQSFFCGPSGRPITNLDARTTKSVVAANKKAAQVVTAGLGALALVDEGVTHAQHLTPLLIEVARPVIGNQFLHTMLMEMVRTMGMTL